MKHKVNKIQKPELLLPAGSLAKLKTVILYGADAVYMGVPDLSLRAKSTFGVEEFKEGISFAKDNGKKVYLTLNLFSHNSDIPKLSGFIKTIKKLKPHGVIISDPGVFQFVHKQLPKLPIHISTQANVCSALAVDFWKNMGASRCVLGREVSFKEALEIRKKCKAIELEIFVHGAMCISYSGRCLMSAFMASRSANSGACAYSCRWKYKSKLVLEEETRPNQYFTLEEDNKGSYVFNSKDLCLISKLDKVFSAGFSSLKIEGRTKSEYYAAQVTRVYRKAIDDYFLAPKKWSPKIYMSELLTLQNRGYTEGFFDGPPTRESQEYNNCASRSEWSSCGFVRKNNGECITLEIKHKLSKNDEIELLSPYRFEPYKLTLNNIMLAGGNKIVESISPGRSNQSIKIFLPKVDAKLFPVYSVARIKLRP
ncbi:MAG: U32 family peptidase [Endomicrobiales bacterium]|nr:U32 family peptidase [Endomicrobiales bacterium]